MCSVYKLIGIKIIFRFLAFLYVKAPTLGERLGRPRRLKKIRPSDRDPMAMDKRESYYFGVLNKIYLQNFLHG